MMVQRRAAARWVPWLWLALPAAWFWRVLASPNAVWAWPGGQFSDLLITHLPNAVFIHRSLALWHQLPLWNPTILSGMPVVGDPLAGVWYPPLWLAVAFPSAAAFNALVWLHLGWAGWGVYRFARAEGLSIWPAVLAASVFSGSPKLIGQAALGHVTLVMAVAWTPWWLLALSSGGVQSASVSLRSNLVRGVKAGTVLGVMFLADPRWLLAAVGLGAGFSLRRWIDEAWDVRTVIRRRLLGWLAGGVQAGLIAAVLALPMWQLVALSTRNGMSPSESTALSLPAGRLLGLLIPDFGGWPEWLTYVGLASLALGLACIVLNGRGWRFWALVAVVGWLLALGDNTPLYPLLVRTIPGLAWQRVPARMLFLSITGMAMLSGIGLQVLMDPPVQARRIHWLKHLAVAWLALFVTLGVGAGVFGGRWGAPAIRWGMVAAGAAGTFAAAGLLLRVPLGRKPWLMGMFWMCLVVAEFGVLDGTLLTARPVPGKPAGAMPSQGVFGSGRIFSPSYSVPQNLAAEAQLELAEGVNPLQLQSYWRFMAEAVGFDASQYSVTLPPFPSGDPANPTVWRLDLHRLGWLNVSQIVSGYPLTADGLVSEGQENGRYFYDNPDASPRAWVQRDQGLALTSPDSQARIERWSPNEIQVSAVGPGRLVLSEIMYPGWGVSVDGSAQALQPAGGLLRSVELGDGSHEVRLAFVPLPALWGAGLSLLGLIAAALAWSQA